MEEECWLAGTGKEVGESGNRLRCSAIHGWERGLSTGDEFLEAVERSVEFIRVGGGSWAGEAGRGVTPVGESVGILHWH